MPDTSKSYPSLRAQWLGLRMREHRENAGRTLPEVAEYLGARTSSTVSRYETGAVAMRWTDVDALLTFYNVADQRVRDELIALAREAWRKGWWDEYRDVVGDRRFLDAFWLESRARSMRIFSMGFVHGLLQTPAYMEAIFRDDPDFDAPTAERAARLRRSRQEILQDEQRPAMTVVLGEAILRQRIGSPAVMREQLAHLLNLGRAGGTITLRVLPFDATVYRALSGPFTLFELEEPFPPVAYVENLAGCLYVEAPMVERYLRAYDDVDNAALTMSESIKVIERAIKEWQ